MKTIISILLILFSVAAVADDSFPKGRIAAVGDEPNGDGQAVEEVPQAGVTKLGAGSQQPKVCEKCQESNTLLSSSKRKAQPGIVQPTPGSDDQAPAGISK